MTELYESSRVTPIVERADVMVAGAGPAGVCAAIMAAREGARTRLIDVNGCLGGIWTAGLLAYVLDASKESGLLLEIVERLKGRDAYRLRSGANFVHDPEQMKLLLEEMCEEAGVEVRYHTRVVGAKVSAQGRLEYAITESKSGREAWGAEVFIDCSGDGDLAALAGCEYSVGHAGTGGCQPMSLLALVSGLDAEAAFHLHSPSVPGRRQAVVAEFVRAGYETSYGSPTFFHIRDDLFGLMTNHQYGVGYDDAQEITEATVRARREVHEAVEALRSLGGIWKNLRLIATAAQIGVREGRRLRGRAEVTWEDLVSGRRREDAVCRATFGMDVHSPDPLVSKDFDASERKQVLPYDIPYGALVAAKVEGLMMAGRCISGDFLAHSSYRVTGNAVVMGEAAGMAAAYCVRRGVLPHEVQWPLVLVVENERYVCSTSAPRRASRG